MDLFTKLDFYVDYNNTYSLRKALNTLGREFELASRNKNIGHAKTVIRAAHQLYEKLCKKYKESDDYRETMSYSQKLLSKQMISFISYLTQRMKSEFGILSNEQEIGQVIGE